MNTNGVSTEMIHQLQMIHAYLDDTVNDMSLEALTLYYDSLQCGIGMMQHN
jgi:hypothetical protein